jgi:2,3-bisphosphoglycerate-independent phosphoglycerate mutase
VAFLQLGVDEAVVEPPQGTPIDRRGDRRRQVAAQQLRHLLRLAEDEAEQGIVRADEDHGHRNVLVRRGAVALRLAIPSSFPQRC